jgi:hypothetical protein
MEHRCDKFVEMVGWSHQQMADRIRDDNINVLIDTTGYTMNMQTEVFAIGPSPVQVGGCGCGCVWVCGRCVNTSVCTCMRHRFVCMCVHACV